MKTVSATLENGVGSNLVWEQDYKLEASKGAESISNPGRFLSFLAGGTNPSLRKAGAQPGHSFCSLLGDGQGAGNVWAAAFCHKAFTLRKANNEFPRQDTTQYFN